MSQIKAMETSFGQTNVGSKWRRDHCGSVQVYGRCYTMPVDIYRDNLSPAHGEYNPKIPRPTPMKCLSHNIIKTTFFPFSWYVMWIWWKWVSSCMWYCRDRAGRQASWLADRQVGWLTARESELPTDRPTDRQYLVSQNCEIPWLHSLLISTQHWTLHQWCEMQSAICKLRSFAL